MSQVSSSHPYYLIPGKDLSSLFEALKRYGVIYGPVKTGERSYAFRRVKSLDEVDLLYARTLMPPKKLFMRPKEDIFIFDKGEQEFREIPDEEEGFVVFGVHACDINALNLLDRVYLNEAPDRYYSDRRGRSLLVGVSCRPDEHCFCESTGTSFVNDGFDLFLHEIGDRHLIRVGSEKGYEVVKGLSLRSVSPVDVEEYKASVNAREKQFMKDFNSSGLQTALDLSFADPVWKEYGDKCLGCGSCSMVCPTCRCWDMKDHTNLDLTTGARTRMWYSCTLADHGLVAGGLNFRPSTTERLRNRFNCKGSLAGGTLNCVGCGRCTAYCPAGIDFVEVMRRVRGEGGD